MNYRSRLLCVGLMLMSGCSSVDDYSFIQKSRSVDPKTGTADATSEILNLNDAFALKYAASVASILRCKFNGARIAREVSSTAQVGLAAASGAGAALGFGATTVTGLALGSAGIPELQKIFDAKGHAQVYQDAVRLIEEAEIEYLAHNPTPSATELTPNGVTLFQRVTASIHVVEKTLAGTLPSVQDMQQATEQMTPTGALPLTAGDVTPNNISAAGGIPPGKSALLQIAARRHKFQVQLASDTPPPSIGNHVVIPKALESRNIALQRAFPINEAAAVSILKNKHILQPDWVSAQETLAQAILTAANLPLKPQTTALSSLSQWRSEADTVAKLSKLEGAYRQYVTIPDVGNPDTADHAQKMAKRFGNLTRAQAADALHKANIDPGAASPRTLLATKILAAAGQNFPLKSTGPVESLMYYCHLAESDEDVEMPLERAFVTFLSLQ